MKKHNRNRIAIFGGSFNPCTKGHIKVAQMILNKNEVDKVWFMPCFNHNFGKLTANPLDRIEMLYRAIKGKKNMEVCLYEVLTESDGKLFNTMEHLIAVNPNTEFKVIIGMDCATQINHWYNWEKLIELVPFIIVAREGYDIDGDRLFCHVPHIVIQDKTKYEYSSTLARKSIEKKDRVAQNNLMYRGVINYIEQNGLYI